LHRQIIIKVVYYKLDNFLDDKEWAEFYEMVVLPFINCDKNFDNSLNMAEMKACLSGL